MEEKEIDKKLENNIEEEHEDENNFEEKELKKSLKNFDEEIEKNLIKFNEELKNKASNFNEKLENNFEKLNEDLKKIKEIYEKKIKNLMIEENEYAKLNEEFQNQKFKSLKDNWEKNNKKIDELYSKCEKEYTDLVEEKNKVKQEKNKYENLIKVLNENNNDADYNEIKSEIEQKFERKNKEKDIKIENLRKEIEELNNKLCKYTDIEYKMKEFERNYGDNPDNLKRKYKEFQIENDNLKKSLSESKPYSEFSELKNSNEELKENIKQKNNEIEELKRINAIKENYELELKNITSLYELEKKHSETLEEKLNRLVCNDQQEIDRQKRIDSIMNKDSNSEYELPDSNGNDTKGKEISEIEWLNNLFNNCSEYGIKFNKRILYAFHTALKINEWSTITVLAGVSGTGKSELPRLYSKFGGLYFCSVAVQPNWDSQESMLGYFNSIDNKFEAEPVLKFLVRCTTDEKYKDYMSIVLLDEMNLAHIEHYFAEFLSKLEERRGMSKDNIPNIEVKLGARVKPYELKLSRTILWVGTMNQDETTKSLSDKVLDRGIVINFPRPKKLESRRSMKIMDNFIKKINVPRMHRTTWSSWVTHKLDFSEEQMIQINKYEEIVEEINEALELVGRAIGHRVWQSIEYYIANYPTVRKELNYSNSNPQNLELTTELKEAMNIAFEDQIVQKIMPKLRGIETNSKLGKECLDKISKIFENNDFTSLIDDFKFAREQGYGQFVWNSAKFLESGE